MKFIEKIRDLLYLSPLYDWLGKRSYAQSGEDLIVWGELAERVPRCHSATVSQDKGFYVDVGAYHPKLFSNTYLFYKKGWRGICVDPNPKMKELYRMAKNFQNRCPNKLLHFDNLFPNFQLATRLHYHLVIFRRCRPFV